MVQKKKKGGYVYGLESTRNDGSKQIYIGMTRRPPSERLEEHKRSCSKKSKRY